MLPGEGGILKIIKGRIGVQKMDFRLLSQNADQSIEAKGSTSAC